MHRYAIHRRRVFFLLFTQKSFSGYNNNIIILESHKCNHSAWLVSKDVKNVLYSIRVSLLMLSLIFYLYYNCTSEGGIMHTWAKGNLRVDGLRNKLCDELFCFSLMHMQCYLLCPFWALLLKKGCTIKQAILMCVNESLSFPVTGEWRTLLL